MSCPNCDGRGFHVGRACPGFHRVEVPCSTCKGTGDVTAEFRTEWMENQARGRALRDGRVARDLSLMEEAKRLGVTPMVLSRMEHGDFSTPIPG